MQISESGTRPTTRLRLKALSAGAVGVRNGFYRSAAVPLGSFGMFHWQPSGVSSAVGLSCTVQGASMWWGLQPWSALDPLFEADFSQVPAAVLLHALSDAAAPLVSYFEMLLGGPAAAVSFGARPAELSEPVDSLELGFVLMGESLNCVARGAFCAGIPTLQSASSRLDMTTSASARGAVPLWVAVEMARVDLSLTELLDLHPGDAIRIARLSNRIDRHRVTLAPGGRPMLHAQISEGRLIVESIVTDLQSTPQGFPVGPGLDALDDVQCTVTFEIGRLSMSVAEVASLGVGSIVPLAQRLDDQPAWIVVNGQRVGRADLAEVGDELVAVVTALKR